MHIQAKATPAKSPPDLEAFIRVLSEPETPSGEDPRQPINIEGVSGADLETGGEIVFSFDHDRVDDVVAWLTEAEYTRIEILDAEAGDFFLRPLDGDSAPGQLLEAIREATLQNLSAGRLIKHVVIGQETQPDHRSYVQISFQEVKRG